ncbi:MAG: GIY-YIG nuclease family protein [Nitrospinae bacterium]|nr:GIY-YIG nuclease family protein [Nitrospinota bacterium]
MVRTRSGKLYTGITTDLERRFQEHARTKRGAKFFRVSQPEAIAFKETAPNRSEAARREMEIKKMSRAEKLRLIEERQRTVGSNAASG